MNIPFDILSQLLLVALLIEAIVTNIKPIYDKTKGWQIDIILTLILSIVICVLVRIDLFALVGIPMILPYVGSVLTGIIVSRGANAVHDLIASLEVLMGNWKTGGSK